MEAVIFIGVQASGKSTFYRQRFVDTHLRLNLDMLRTRHREAILLRACLAAKQSFVVDNTNPTRAERAKYITAAHEAGFRVIGYYFSAKLKDALARNAQRTGKQCVPEQGVRATYQRLELPRYDEGFDMLHYVQIADDGTFICQEWQVNDDEI